MLDRAVLIHLKLIDLPVRPAHEKCWVTVLYDMPIHAYRLNEILLIGGEPARAPISDHTKEIPSRQSLLTDQWRLAACSCGCTVRVMKKSIFNLGVNCV